MEGHQYDLFLFLMDDYQLEQHQRVLEAAQRLQRHQGLGAEDYTSELDAIAMEMRRRKEEFDAF